MSFVPQSAAGVFLNNPAIALGPAQAPGLATSSAALHMPGMRGDGFSPSAYMPASGMREAFGSNGTNQASIFGAPGGFGSSNGSNGSQGGFFGVLNNLISQLDRLINSYAGGSTGQPAGSQNVADATFASTGDPHLSETGTTVNGSGNTVNGSGTTANVNSHFDSMSSHDNLLSSQDFTGGYRLSTAVTTPNANGITLNQSATVHMNNDLDKVTMRNDGSVSIASDGNNVVLGKGQSLMLEGGELVTSNSDGSLTVAEQNEAGGTISTTLRTNGNGGVDATATVHNATVGGDIVTGTATPEPPSLSNAGVDATATMHNAMIGSDIVTGTVTPEPPSLSNGSAADPLAYTPISYA